MSLLVQKFLETHTFKELQEQHGVYASFSQSGHKFSLNYDQIEAQESDPLAQECRGLILAQEDGLPVFATGTTGFSTRDLTCPGKTVILAYPMKRFFNHGQGSAATIDWSDPKLSILEKLDGTLCIVYYDLFINKWCVATRSVPEADIIMDNGLYTFRTLFEKALQDTCGESFENYTDKLDKEITYCFELTTPYNRIVVEYKTNKVTLLAARHVLYETDQYGLKLCSLEEADISKLDTFGVPVVQAYTYNSIDELVSWVSTLNPMEHEGVVVRDGNFNRIKVKNPAYGDYNKLHDRLGSSERNCMELVLLEKDDDVAPFLPIEIVTNMQNLKAGLQKVLMKYDSVFNLAMLNMSALGLHGNKKEFALYINKHKNLWAAPFFQMYDGKASNMKDFILKNRKDGTWGNSFLDKILELVKQN